MAKQQTKTTFLYPYLRKEMSVKGITISELARRMGVATSTLRNKLSGETRFFLDEVRFISSILDKDMDQLFKTD